MRCGGCKYTFQNLTGRWINNGNLPLSLWLDLLHRFAEDATVHQLAAES